MSTNKVFSDLRAGRSAEGTPRVPVEAATPIPDVRAALLAGGLGERMGKLTDAVCKPMVPYAGVCRLVDFSMANVVRSGVPQALQAIDMPAQCLQLEATPSGKRTIAWGERRC